jgi:membrane protein DedA with SNARE-associated domain
MSLQELITTYGYTAIGIGTFLEGETILILGGLAAHSGYLELPWVIVCAFFGTLFGDQLFFYRGRTKGKDFFDKHQALLILGFRFLYGLRTITPFIIGASRISPLRFLIINIIGASIWASLVGSLGYLFGQTLELLIGDIKRYELLIFAVLAGIGIVFWLTQLYKKSSANKSTQSRPKSDTNDKAH